jgi:hypothetical protein
MHMACVLLRTNPHQATAKLQRTKAPAQNNPR